jgi:hypothetical protein
MAEAERFFQARITSTIKPKPRISGARAWKCGRARSYLNQVALTFPRAYFSALMRLVGRVVNWFTALVAGSEMPSACLEHTL